MTFVRQSVWAKDGDFTDPILLWYAKGVGALKKRPISDRTSWGFIAAIHGIDLQEWLENGYYTHGAALPSDTEQETFWNQCQHGSWYFLP